MVFMPGGEELTPVELVILVIALKHSEQMVVVRCLRMNVTRQVVLMVGISQAPILIVLHLVELLLQAISHTVLAMLNLSMWM